MRFQATQYMAMKTALRINPMKPFAAAAPAAPPTPKVTIPPDPLHGVDTNTKAMLAQRQQHFDTTRADTQAAGAAAAHQAKIDRVVNIGLQAGMTVLPMLANSVMQRQHEKQYHGPTPQQVASV